LTLPGSPSGAANCGSRKACSRRHRFSDDGIGEEQILVVLRHRRGVVAAAALVAFNLVMFLLANAGQNSMDAPFLVAWITGDAVLSLAALALTEPRSPRLP